VCATVAVLTRIFAVFRVNLGGSSVQSPGQEVALTKKWYELFVSVDNEGSAPNEGTALSNAAAGSNVSRTAAQTVAEIASKLPAEPQFTSAVKNPTSFEEIYRAAEIQIPGHGYTIYKIAEMLQSEHIRNLSAEVKRSSVLLALDAAGVKVEDVIQDAVRRDRALDTYERVQQKSFEQLQESKSKENADIQADIDRYVAQQRAKMDANNDAIAREKERLYSWRLNKQQEEQKIADAVSYFVTENPITTSQNAAPSTPATKAGSSSSK
jgi:hypothetical protein